MILTLIERMSLFDAIRLDNKLKKYFTDEKAEDRLCRAIREGNVDFIVNGRSGLIADDPALAYEQITGVPLFDLLSGQSYEDAAEECRRDINNHMQEGWVAFELSDGRWIEYKKED